MRYAVLLGRQRIEILDEIARLAGCARHRSFHFDHHVRSGSRGDKDRVLLGPVAPHARLLNGSL
jgi:hypothetical protein